MEYTNSSMVEYTKLSDSHSGQRTHSIDRITPHCVVGQVTAERLGDIFSGASFVSSNYGIDKDGRVGMYVEECNRSWCSSNNDNDQRAITIECASDTKAPYEFRAAVYDTLIKLCTDICKRNGKKKLLWLVDKDKSLAYTPKSDEMVLTVHRWFANKDCPGEWLMVRMDDLATKVTKNLNDIPKPKCPYTEPTKTIRAGAKGNNVKWLQWHLNQCGENLKIDGDFGPSTNIAVLSFQKKYNLTVDGIVGPSTRAKLKKAGSIV